jgi:hypothetical protein
MMTDALNGTQAEALAVLVRTLRPEWDVPGVKSALFKARDRGNAFEVIHAALYAAEDLANRTPAIIALAGPHWTRGRELGSSNPRGEKCDQPGHEGKPAHNCSYCIADRKARDDEAAPVTAHVVDEDQMDVNERGIRRLRAVLGQREDS